MRRNGNREEFLKTRIDFPTISGQIVGRFNDASGDHGFLDTAGVFTTINDPSALPAVGGTAALGINNSGQIVGEFHDASGIHGFLDTAGVFTTIDDPSASLLTDAFGINNSGQIVGMFFDATGGQHGFLDHGGVFTTIDDPSSLPGTTNALGINDSAQIVGIFDDATHRTHGFLATPTAIPEPGSLTLLGSGLIGLAAAFRRKLASGRSQ